MVHDTPESCRDRAVEDTNNLSPSDACFGDFHIFSHNPPEETVTVTVTSSSGAPAISGARLSGSGSGAPSPKCAEHLLTARKATSLTSLLTRCSCLMLAMCVSARCLGLRSGSMAIRSQNVGVDGSAMGCGVGRGAEWESLPVEGLEAHGHGLKLSEDKLKGARLANRYTDVILQNLCRKMTQCSFKNGIAYPCLAFQKTGHTGAHGNAGTSL